MKTTTGNLVEVAKKAALEINTAQMDARVLNSAIVNLLEKFEYRPCDQETIDALYAFTRLLGASIEKIKDASGKVEELAFGSGGPVAGGAA